jgi:hypothetical protein
MTLARGVAGGAFGSTSGNGNANDCCLAIGAVSIADGTSGDGYGNSGGVGLNGGHTHQDCMML